MTTFKIYQLKDSKSKELLFVPFDDLKEPVDINNYKLVFKTTSYVISHKSIYDELEYIYRIFNFRHPANFEGHSLSISDIVELDDQKYYVDDFGFKKL